MTAVFSVVQAVLLRPLPFKGSGQLISLHERVEEDPHDFNVTAPDILIFQRESKAFSGEGGYIGTDYDLTGAGAPFHAAAERVTASLFPTLGIDPLLGRTFTQEEDENGVPVAVISYSLWRERFRGIPVSWAGRLTWIGAPTRSSESCREISSFLWTRGD